MRNSELEVARERVKQTEHEINKLHLAKKPIEDHIRELRSAGRYNAEVGNNALQKRIKELLGEQTGTATSNNSDELGNALTELNAYDSAMDALRARLANERRALGNLISDSLRSEHSKRAKEFASAICRLHAVHLEYKRFLNEAEDAGANLTNLRIVQPTQLGSPFDRSGEYHYLLADIVDAGHITKADIPEAVR
jgi:chromosome segregation ATPase